MRGLSLLVVACAGCATLFNSGTQQLSIEANPGAPIVVDGLEVGKSPGVVEVSSHVDHDIVVGGRGCHLDAEVGVGWVIADIFLTGLIGVVVDAVTGDWRSIHASECRI